MTKQEAWISLKIRFIERLKIKRNGCWICELSYKDKHGYSYLSLTRRNSKRGTFSRGIRVHRIAYRLFFGKIEKGMLICHKCDNPACCNPKHLFMGTNEDNMRDMALKGRAFISWGEKSGMHKLTTTQVQAIRASNARQIDLANKYGVSKSTICEIINYKSRCYE